MNGQDRPQPNFSTSTTNSAVFSGAGRGSLWRRDKDIMGAGPGGIPSDHNALMRTVAVPHAPLRYITDLPYSKGSSATAERSLVDVSAPDQRLLVPCATTSNFNAAQIHSSLYSQPSKNHVHNPADPEIAAKRLKLSNDRPSNPAHSQPSIPHRPQYFHCGSVIQLGENKLKRIEDLQTSDFEYSASISSDLSLDSSTVVKISEDSSRGTAYLTFSVGDHKHTPIEATVEATVEHPFFVFGQGWSSVRPESTYNYYKMKCQQLKVRDRCISLTLKDTASINSQNSSAASAKPHPAYIVDAPESK